MAKVISLSTRAKLNSTPNVDKDIAKTGRYLGCLPKPDADNLRAWQEMLLCTQNSIVEQLARFNEVYAEYLNNATQVLLYFHIDPSTFNPDTEIIAIGEDGHVWLAPIPEMEE